MDNSDITGLPEVGEGFFWRISKRTHSTYYPYEISLMRKTKKVILGLFIFRSSEVVGADLVSPSQANPDGFRWAARELIRYNGFKANDKSYVGTDFSGDYPPKKMEN